MSRNVLITGNGTQIQQEGSVDGAGLVQQLHGKYYEAAANGRMFYASTVIAGVVVPVAAATLNSKFTLWNPAASGKNVELVSIFVQANVATTVVGNHALLVQKSLATAGGVPTTVTTLCPSLPAGINSEASGITVAAQATLTNAQIPGVATTPYIGVWPLGGYGAVTNGSAVDLTHNFDGKLILAPDSLVALCATVAASAASFCQICWIELDV